MRRDLRKRSQRNEYVDMIFEAVSEAEELLLYADDLNKVRPDLVELLQDIKNMVTRV